MTGGLLLTKLNEKYYYDHVEPTDASEIESVLLSVDGVTNVDSILQNQFSGIDGQIANDLNLLIAIVEDSDGDSNEIAFAYNDSFYDLFGEVIDMQVTAAILQELKQFGFDFTTQSAAGDTIYNIFVNWSAQTITDFFTETMVAEAVKIFGSTLSAGIFILTNLLDPIKTRIANIQLRDQYAAQQALAGVSDFQALSDWMDQQHIIAIRQVNGDISQLTYFTNAFAPIFQLVANPIPGFMTLFFDYEQIGEYVAPSSSLKNTQINQLFHRYDRSPILTTDAYDLSDYWIAKKASVVGLKDMAEYADHVWSIFEQPAYYDAAYDVYDEMHSLRNSDFITTLLTKGKSKTFKSNFKKYYDRQSRPNRYGGLNPLRYGNSWLMAGFKYVYNGPIWRNTDEQFQFLYDDNNWSLIEPGAEFTEFFPRSIQSGSWTDMTSQTLAGELALNAYVEEGKGVYAGQFLKYCNYKNPESQTKCDVPVVFLCTDLNELHNTATTTTQKRMQLKTTQEGAVESDPVYGYINYIAWTTTNLNNTSPVLRMLCTPDDAFYWVLSDIITNGITTQNRLNLIRNAVNFSYHTNLGLTDAVDVLDFDFGEPKAVIDERVTITFDSDGGSAVPSQHVIFGQPCDEPETPTKQDLEFLGWKNEGTYFNFNTRLYGDITLTAEWREETPIECPMHYNVNFNSDGGDPVPSQYIQVNYPAAEPKTPVKSGYVFKGWYLENDLYNFGSPITQSITLNAEWEKKESGGLPSLPDPIIPVPVPIPTPEPIPEPIPDEDIPDPPDVEPDVPPINIPVLPILPLQNGMASVYCLDNTILTNFGHWLWKPDILKFLKETIFNDAMEGIISLHKLPIPVSLVPTGTDKNIVCGYFSSPITAPIVTRQTVTANLGRIIMPNVTNLLQLQPYSTANLFLPYIGSMDIPMEDIAGSEIHFEYNIDIMTGNFIARVYIHKDMSFLPYAENANDPELIYEFPGNMSVSVPITGGNMNSLFTSAVTGVASIGLAAYTGGSGALAGKEAASKAIKAGASQLGTSGLGFINGGSHSSLNVTGGLSGNSGALGYQKPRLVIKSNYCQDVDIYKEIDGIPSYRLEQLKNMTGNIRVRSIDLKGLSCTQEERDSIYEKLIGGVEI